MDFTPHPSSPPLYAGIRGCRNLSVFTPRAQHITEYSSKESFLSPFNARLNFAGAIWVFRLKNACVIPFSWRYLLISKFSFIQSPRVPIYLDLDCIIFQFYWNVNSFSKKSSRFLDVYIYKIKRILYYLIKGRWSHERIIWRKTKKC